MSIPVASTCRVNQVNLAVKNLNVIHSSLMVYQTKCSGKEFSVLSNNCHDFAEEMFNLASSGPQIEINLDIAYSDKMLFLDLGPGTSDLGSLI